MNFDYRTPGYYFVTICVQDRECVFGEVQKDTMLLNKYGEIVKECWDDLPHHYCNCHLDILGIMPNHIHGIIFLEEVVSRNVGDGFKPSPTQKAHGLSEIIRGFKTFSARKINVLNSSEGKHFHWQRSFYDHIIRDERALENIREYILHNPLKWKTDAENPANF